MYSLFNLLPTKCYKKVKVTKLQPFRTSGLELYIFTIVKLLLNYI